MAWLGGRAFSAILCGMRSLRGQTIAVAMSGGVDSSVCAALLVQEGRRVIGLTMALPPRRTPHPDGRRPIDDAAWVAARLGIAHHVVDVSSRFESRIVRDFCREYARGRTPNPCVRCNRLIKFDLLWDAAEGLGAGVLATGHYARVDRDSGSGISHLRKGRSRIKDQSYFLYQLGQKELRRTFFPLGGLSKEDVRRLARRFGLPAIDRDESQEICFIPDDDYPRFLAARVPEAFRPGPILDRKGRVLGRHRGVGGYTVGQRRGLGIAAARPLYVVSIEPGSNSIVVGPEDDLYRRRLRASDGCWVSGIPPDHPVPLKARIRYRHREAAALVIPQGKRGVLVEFRKPQRAITPGQSVVFYRGDEVVGGATIEEALDDSGPPGRLGD